MLELFFHLVLAVLTKRSAVIATDATGYSGRKRSWRETKHAWRAKEDWVNVHAPIEVDEFVVLSYSLTRANVHDSREFSNMWDRLPSNIVPIRSLADSAYVGNDHLAAARQHGSTPFHSNERNARHVVKPITFFQKLVSFCKHRPRRFEALYAKGAYMVTVFSILQQGHSPSLIYNFYYSSRAIRIGDHLGIKFEYTHEFQETSVDAVRSKIVAWLNAEGAQKIKDNGMASIEAVHGTLKTFRPYERNGKKKLSFDLSPQGRSVIVNATVTPSLAIVDDIRPAEEQTKINWGFLVEELWASVEGVAATKSREHLLKEQKELEVKQAEASKRLPKVLIRFGLMELGFWVVLLLFLVYFLEMEFDTTMWALITILFLGSGTMIAWGLLRMWKQKRADAYL